MLIQQGLSLVSTRCNHGCIVSRPMHHQTSQYIVREWRPNPYNLAGVILHCNYDGYTWLLHFPNPSSHIDTPGASYTISRAH